LLSLNPPAEIEGILRQRIAEWRGEAPLPPEHPPVPIPETEAPAQADAAPIERPGVVVSASLSLSPEAQAALPANAVVFIIARDAAQPSPPIAVVRRQVAELPTQVELGDRESMVPGRSLSGFAEFELVARVSLSGQPTQQPGDWFGSVIVVPEENNRVELTISEQVP
jgi:cytochrome c-type biogenesis protein CcmH